jgi:hypothetical protein
MRSSGYVDHQSPGGKRPGAAKRYDVQSVDPTPGVVEKTSEDKCRICGASVWISTDGNGRLMAWDRWPNKPHPHPEAAMGEWAWKLSQGLEVGPPSKAAREVLTPEQIMEILHMAKPARAVADIYGCSESLVREIWSGRVYRQKDVDYKALRKLRSAGRPQRRAAFTREDLLAIIRSVDPINRLCERFSCHSSTICAIRTGHLHPLDDVDYEREQVIRAEIISRWRALQKSGRVKMPVVRQIATESQRMRDQAKELERIIQEVHRDFER